MRRYPFWAVSAMASVVVAVLMLPSLAFSATWEELLEAGRKEGTVVVTGPSFPSFRDAIIGAFEQDTGIKVEWKPLVGGPGPFTAQLLREGQAKSISTDVYIGGTTSCFNFIREDTVRDLKEVLVHPEVVDASKWRAGRLTIQTGDGQMRPKEFWCFFQTADWVMGDLFVNPNLVKPDEIQSWKDLLDPKFKGKILAHDPRTPGAGRATAAYLYSLFGEDFIRKLYIGQDVALDTSYSKPAEDVARGRYAIGLAFVQASVERLRQQGLPIQRVFPKDGMGLLTGGFSAVSLLKGPNANAGAVFVNWWGTKRAQEIAQCQLLEASLRNDLSNNDCVPDWTRPQAGVQYPVHDYEQGHHFGAKMELQGKVDQIWGK